MEAGEGGGRGVPQGAGPPEPEAIDRRQPSGGAGLVDRVAVQHHLDFVQDRLQGGSGLTPVQTTAGHGGQWRGGEGDGSGKAE